MLMKRLCDKYWKLETVLITTFRKKCSSFQRKYCQDLLIALLRLLCQLHSLEDLLKNPKEIIKRKTLNVILSCEVYIKTLNCVTLFLGFLLLTKYHHLIQYSIAEALTYQFLVIIKSVQREQKLKCQAVTQLCLLYTH